MKFEIYTSDCLQIETNSHYRKLVEVHDEATAKEAFSHDFVCAKYKDNHRGNDTFISTFIVPFDIDNDHSDNPDEWIVPKKIEEFFPGIPFVVQYSRNNNKIKESKKGKIGYSPRPRFHFIMPFGREITSYPELKEIKDKIYRTFNFVDPGAKDAGRCFFGTANPEVEFHEGTRTLEQFLDAIDEKKFAEWEEEIPEGKRNFTMHHFAVCLLKRYGISEEAKKLYLEKSKLCNPPLEMDELKTIFNSAAKFFKNKIVTSPNYVKPEDYGTPEVKWSEPLPFNSFEVPLFPLEALPEVLRNYVVQAAETTQTPVDMAATSALCICALAMQGRYRVIGKPDWEEPVNLYGLLVAEPSERKSSIVDKMAGVLYSFEKEYNAKRNDAYLRSKMEKAQLEFEYKSLQGKYAKGKATKDELHKALLKLAEFKELKPLKLFVDDITTEKLNSVLSDNDGQTGIISSEGGIFDVLAGMYSKNVNIDAFLKAYSGDPIRVDRIGRESEIIEKPCMSILLAVQPNVLSSLISNSIFLGRGLTTRFLYTIPQSLIGKRKFETEPISEPVKLLYEAKIKDLLYERKDSCDTSTIKIHLSPEAKDELEKYFNENEYKMANEYQEIKTWSGKIVGTVLRISAILARVQRPGHEEFTVGEPEPIIVSQEEMQNAIKIGKYFTEHAKAAFTLMGIDPVVKQAEKIVATIKKLEITQFTKREMLRSCRIFKSVEDMMPALNKLSDYGYIQIKPETKKVVYATYLVNPYLLEKKEEN